jgi:hypothetical protein
MSRHEDQTKIINDVPDLVLAKSEEQPERHVLDYSKFVYRYVKEEANIFLHMCDRHGNQFIARLEPDRSRVFDDEFRVDQIGGYWKSCFGSLQSDSDTLVRTQAIHDVGNSKSDKQSMFVNVVQLIQDPEIYVPGLIRSLCVEFMRQFMRQEGVKKLARGSR